MKALALLLGSVLSAAQTASDDEALRRAVRDGRYALAEELLGDSAVDPDAQDADGWTALMYAADENDPDLVLLLLKAKIDLDVVNEDGESALVIAARRGNVEAARQLLMAGADVTIRDDRGRTALDWAERDNRTYLSQIIRIASRPSVARVTVSEKPLTLGSDTLVPPQVVEEHPPLYTERAFNDGVEGRVVLKVIVRKDGTVGPIRIHQSLDRELDEAAMQAIRTWRFEPARIGEEPINVLTDVEFDFSIQKKKT